MNTMLSIRFHVVLLVAASWALMACGDRHPMTSEHQSPPLYDIVVENRHDSMVAGWLQFGDTRTNAGGDLAPGKTAAHLALGGGIPATASMRMSVFPPGTTDFQHTPWTTHDAVVDVKKQLPPDVHDGVFYFIIQQDLSLRLVLLSHERYQAMKAAGTHPD
jgi:hypothetical protein